MYGSTLSYDKTNYRLNLLEDVIQIDIIGTSDETLWIKETIDNKEVIKAKRLCSRSCILQVGFAFIDKNIYSGHPIVIDLSSKYRKYLVLLPRTI